MKRPPELSSIKSSLYNGLGNRLKGDVSPFKAKRQVGKTLQPQQKGDRFFHIVSDATCFNTTFGRCIGCQKDQRLSNFWLAKDAEALVKKRNFVLEAICNSCRTLEQRTALAGAPGYNPELDKYWTANFSSLCIGAQARGIEITITKDDLLARYLRNDCKCEVTGVLLKPERGKSNRLAPSVDRIDSAGDYSLRNIQIVARVVNLMKGDLDMDEFVAWCKCIAGLKT